MEITETINTSDLLECSRIGITKDLKMGNGEMVRILLGDMEVRLKGLELVSCSTFSGATHRIVKLYTKLAGLEFYLELSDIDTKEITVIKI